MNDIETLIAQKDFKTAKSLIEDLLISEPENISLLKNLGLCLVNLEENQKALDTFLKVIDIEGHDATSLFYAAALYEKLNDNKNAIKYYKKLIEIRENYIDAYKNLTMIYMNEKMVEDASQTAKKLHEMTKGTNKDFMIPFLYANVQIYHKNLDIAVELLNEAASLNPNYIKTWNTLGCVMLSKQNYEQSLEYFKKALELDELDSVTQYNIATLYLIRGNYKKAADHFKSAYTVLPTEQTLSQLALSQFKDGDYNAAAVSYRELCTKNPQSLNYRFNYAQCLYEQKLYKQAISILVPIVEQNPKSAKIAHKLALCYEGEGHIRNAAQIYEKMLKLGNIPEEIYIDYARMLVKDNDKQKAELVLKKLIGIKPEYALAHKDLGVIYLSGRLFDEAAQEFEKALEYAPENPSVIFEYANFNQAISNYIKADEYYEKAEKLLRDDYTVFLMHGLNKIKENEINGAKQLFEKVISIHSKCHEALYNLAQIAFSEKKYEIAKEYLTDAYVIRADSETSNLLALTLLELHEYHDAKVILNRLNIEIPNNTSILTALARAEFLDNNPQKAKEYLDKVLAIFPESSEAQELMQLLK